MKHHHIEYNRSGKTSLQTLLPKELYEPSSGSCLAPSLASNPNRIARMAVAWEVEGLQRVPHQHLWLYSWWCSFN